MRHPLSAAALAVATAALAVSLDLPAWASSQINGKHLKNGSVSGAKLKDATITGRQVKDDGLTGADIAESSLGTVPSAASAASATSAANAAALGGHPASAFLDTTHFVRISRLVDSSSPITIASNGPLAIAADCHAAAPTGYHVAMGSMGGYTIDAVGSVDGSSPFTMDVPRTTPGVVDVMQYGLGSGTGSSLQNVHFVLRADSGETISGLLAMSVNKTGIGAHCALTGFVVLG
jgi:hypothetical protein